MKQVDMKQRKALINPIELKTHRIVTSAFDVWLNRGLHELFDEVANEPIPENLLKLFEEHEKDQN